MQENIHFDPWSIFSFHVQNKFGLIFYNYFILCLVIVQNKKDRDIDDKNNRDNKNKNVLS
jgi:hypothetical protein